VDRLQRTVASALVVVIALSAIVALRVNVATHRPVHFRLTDHWCRELRNAKGAAATAPVPCSMTAYLAHSDIGWVGYGYSQNVHGQCLMLAYAMVDRASFEVDDSAPAIQALPASCSTQWAPFHPRMGMF